MNTPQSQKAYINSIVFSLDHMSLNGVEVRNLFSLEKFHQLDHGSFQNGSVVPTEIVKIIVDTLYAGAVDFNLKYNSSRGSVYANPTTPVVSHNIMCANRGDAIFISLSLHDCIVTYTDETGGLRRLLPAEVYKMDLRNVDHIFNKFNVWSSDSMAVTYEVDNYDSAQLRLRIDRDVRKDGSLTPSRLFTFVLIKDMPKP